MKRTSYVDSSGNVVNSTLESKKPLLNFFFVFGTIIPIILICLIIYTVVVNGKCSSMDKQIKSATYTYLNEQGQLPNVEGESITISLSKLYNNNYLSELNTNKTKCSGKVKTTNYKGKYIYTLELKNCGVCSTDGKSWSNEVSYLPSKRNIDVIPYYNYYEREVNTTAWSNYFEKEEISSKESEYGVKLPLDLNKMPKVPEEANIYTVEKEDTYKYSYKDKRWKFYDIVGNYSEYSSTWIDGYASKDEGTQIYTVWSKYQLEYPEEHDYREIVSANGYIFYYEKDGKKVYANNKKYTPEEEVDRTKYDKREDKSQTMYKYRDKMWRYYNGQKRRYSSYSSTIPSGYNYKDEETVTETSYSSWSFESQINSSNSSYRTEQTKTVSRYRYIYEILSDKLLEKPVNKEEFINIIGESVVTFVEKEDYKVEVTYKFKYQK